MNPSNNFHNQTSDSDEALASGSQSEPGYATSLSTVEEASTHAQSAPAVLAHEKRGFQASFYHSGFNGPVAYDSAILDIPARVAADRGIADSNQHRSPRRSPHKYFLIMDNVIPGIKTD